MASLPPAQMRWHMKRALRHPEAHIRPTNPSAPPNGSPYTARGWPKWPNVHGSATSLIAGQALPGLD